MCSQTRCLNDSRSILKVREMILSHSLLQMVAKEGCWRSETSRRERKRVRLAKQCIITMTDLYLRHSVHFNSLDVCPRCYQKLCPQQNTDDWLSKLTAMTPSFVCSVCNKMTKYPPDRSFLCMDLTYITCLLKDGFGFKESTVLQVRPFHMTHSTWTTVLLTEGMFSKRWPCIVKI